MQFERQAVAAAVTVRAITAALIWTALPSSRSQTEDARLLYFTHSAGYRHEVIPTSQAVLKEIGAESGFAVT